MSSSDGALRRRASTKRRFAVAFPAGREKGKDACGTRSSSLFSPPSPFVSLFCAFFSGASLPPPVYLFAARVHKFCQRRGWREGEENRKKSAGVLGVSKIPQSLACGESGPLPSPSFSFPFSWSGGGGSECNFSAPSASFLFILQLCAAAERVFSLSFVCRCYSLLLAAVLRVAAPFLSADRRRSFARDDADAHTARGSWSIRSRRRAVALSACLRLGCGSSCCCF